MFESRAQFRPGKPFQDLRPGNPVDPDLLPSPAAFVLPVILRRTRLEEKNIARPRVELAALVTDEAAAQLGGEQQPVLRALRSPAMNDPMGILVSRIERSGRRRR